ncbi:hypothetical protein NQZ68_034904 [Dissostichus eleginoides]|nr:hypothetical protein NQZ68_034904 [Dissostichus eleginoides]
MPAPPPAPQSPVSDALFFYLVEKGEAQHFDASLLGMRVCKSNEQVQRVPDNGLVKAGILRAPAPFDCVGQLWRNGHYLPVSGSIKKPPCPSYPCVRVPTGGGTWAAALSARPPSHYMCPDGRARGPNEPFGTERKEGASYSCDVGVVVPFNAFAMATGPKPWKHAAPLS